MTSQTIKVKDFGGTNFRKPSQMSGDFLLYLKKQFRGEMSQSVRGHNAAAVMSMKSQVDSWYEEQRLFLRRLKRSQGKVYNTMLFIDKEKKKLKKIAKRKLEATQTIIPEEEEKLKGKADELPAKVNQPSEVLNEIKVFQPLPDIVVQQHHNPSGYSGIQDSNNGQQAAGAVQIVINDVQIPGVDSKRNLLISSQSNSGGSSPTKKSRSRALEVTKPLNLPMIREMTKEVSSVMDNINTVMTAQNAMPIINLNNTNRKRHQKTKSVTSSEVDSYKNLATKDALFTKRKLDPMPASPATPLSQTSKRKSKSLDSLTEFSLGAEASNTTPSDEMHLGIPYTKQARRGSVSMVELKKLAEKKREEARRKILEQEPINVYKKTATGKVEQDILPFKRNKFLIPTNHEQRIRKQLLESQRQALQQHKSKMDTFFSKLDKQKEEEWRPKTPPPPPPEQKEIEAGAREMGGEMNAFVAAFTQQPYSSDIDPNSAEALTHCRYIRTYTPRPEDGDGRRSSWSISTPSIIHGDVNT